MKVNLYISHYRGPLNATYEERHPTDPHGTFYFPALTQYEEFHILEKFFTRELLSTNYDSINIITSHEATLRAVVLLVRDKHLNAEDISITFIDHPNLEVTVDSKGYLRGARYDFFDFFEFKVNKNERKTNVTQVRPK